MAACVYVQPLGYLNTRLVGRVCLSLKEHLGVEPILLPRAAVGDTAFDAGRRQHQTRALLAQLWASLVARGDDAAKIVGVIDEDIFVPVLSFVFGAAQLGKQAALVSMKRLRQEYYGGARSADLLERRLYKELAHEVLHLYGLPHCPSPDCLMHKADDVTGVDRKAEALCESCAQVARRRMAA